MNGFKESMSYMNVNVGSKVSTFPQTSLKNKSFGYNLEGNYGNITFYC